MEKGQPAVRAQRQYLSRHPPPVLTLQLKRFHFDRKTLTRHKVNTTVAFPLTLDMRPFITLDDDDADAADDDDDDVSSRRCLHQVVLTASSR